MNGNTDLNIAIMRRHLDAMPSIEPPAASYTQDLPGATNVAAGDPNAWFTVVSIEVPAQKRAVVRYLALDCNTPAAPAFIRFRFTINGSPTLNYQSPPYIFGDLTHPSKIWIDVPQQNVVALQLRNLDVTTGYLVLSRLILWSWDVNLPAMKKEA